jgi:alpha-tubulin suppressor-like RCC1 family protein
MKIGRNRKRDLVRGVITLAFIWFAGVHVMTTPQPVAHASSPWVNSGWDDIEAGGISSCGRLGSETYCWGYLGGRGKQLYNGYPVSLDRTGDIGTAAVSDMQPGYFHTCLVAEGKIYCYGRNTTGELGTGTVTPDIDIPAAVDTSSAMNGLTATAVSASPDFTCGVASARVYCWGGNSAGQLGNGTTTNSSVPVAVDTSGVLAGKTVTDLATGNESACVIASGSVYCWGWGGAGELGNGIIGNSSVPVAVDTSGVLAGKTVTDLTMGSRSACVIASGSVYCWGNNSAGQLGNGTTTNSSVPVAVDTSGVLAGKTVRRGQYMCYCS